MGFSVYNSVIIGGGDIASILNDRDGAIFFASGISNSSMVDPLDAWREYQLLINQPLDRCLFYFSTVSIYYKSNDYTTHKKIMEAAVRRWFTNYNIIRIGNIDWGTNPNTFLNALKAKKAKGEPFEIFDEYRYMISQKELLLLTDNLPLVGQNEINVFGRMAKVKDLI